MFWRRIFYKKPLAITNDLCKETPLSATPQGLHRFRAALAQPVEHRIRNAGVRCSSHLSGTTFPS